MIDSFKQNAYYQKYASLHSKDKNLIFIFFGIVYLLLYSIPFLILKENSYVHIWDNLTNELIYIKLLVENNIVLSTDPNTIVAPIMDGIERNFFRSGFNITFLFFKIFTSFWAYIINMLLVRFIAFCGMFLLLQNYVSKDNRIVVFTISIMYASVSFYSIFGLYSFGIPLLIFALLNILNEKKILLNISILLLYNSYSLPYLSVSSYAVIFLLIGLYFFIGNKNTFKIKHVKLFVLCLVLFFATILIFEQNLIMSVITKRIFLTHRTSYNRYFSISESLVAYKNLLIDLQFHVGKFSTKFIHLLLLIAFLIMLLKRKIDFRIVLTYLVINVIILVSTFYPLVYSTLGKINKIFLAYDGSRIYAILPVFFIILFSLCILYISDYLGTKSKFIKTSFLIVVISFQFLKILQSNDEFYLNIRTLANPRSNLNAGNYKNYYAENSFQKIKQIINKPLNSFKVVCVGFDLSVALYNGLYTLDGYSVNYLLSYKVKFREIISKELDKNETNRKVFDGWGNLCYIYSDDISKRNTTTNNPIKLDIVYSILEKMGANFVISSVAIDDNNLSLIYQKNDNYYKRFYLYKLDAKTNNTISLQ